MCCSKRSTGGMTPFIWRLMIACRPGLVTPGDPGRDLIGGKVQCGVSLDPMPPPPTMRHPAACRFR